MSKQGDSNPVPTFRENSYFFVWCYSVSKYVSNQTKTSFLLCFNLEIWEKFILG